MSFTILAEETALNLLEWLQSTLQGRLVFTTLVSMIPVVELRGGIPFGVGLGLRYWQAFLAAVVGNLIPVPFIIVYIRRVFQWLRVHVPRLGGMVDALEKKAHLKGRKVSRYKYLGLILFVGIPLPGTGAWTGALAAAFLDMRLRQAIPCVIIGVLMAGCIMTGLTHVGINVFSAVLS